jgi:hypothetical protein
VVETTNTVLAATREGSLPVIFTTIGFEANLIVIWGPIHPTSFTLFPRASLVTSPLSPSPGGFVRSAPEAIMPLDKRSTGERVPGPRGSGVGFRKGHGF